MSPRDKVLAEAMQLPERERAEIASELLASLEDEDEGAAQAWALELEQRAREVLSGKAELLDFDDAVEKLSASE